MKLTVKNMICQRCIIVVESILSDFGLEAEFITTGEIMLKEKITTDTLTQLNDALKKTGLELVFDNTDLLVQKIKTIIFEMIHFAEEPLLIKFSCYLSNQLNYSYTYLSNLFKKINGISIECYIIQQKIEKVKQMLVAGDASLKEIAFQLNYSSVAHLSAQFKKVTGITARDYKFKNSYSYFNLTAF
jgi:AraC-like DNA-binding protein